LRTYEPSWGTNAVEFGGLNYSTGDGCGCAAVLEYSEKKIFAVISSTQRDDFYSTFLRNLHEVSN